MTNPEAKSQATDDLESEYKRTQEISKQIGIEFDPRFFERRGLVKSVRVEVIGQFDAIQSDSKGVYPTSFLQEPRWEIRGDSEGPYDEYFVRFFISKDGEAEYFAGGVLLHDIFPVGFPARTSLRTLATYYPFGADAVPGTYNVRMTGKTVNIMGIGILSTRINLILDGVDSGVFAFDRPKAPSLKYIRALHFQTRTDTENTVIHLG